MSRRSHFDDSKVGRESGVGSRESGVGSRESGLKTSEEPQRLTDYELAARLQAQEDRTGRAGRAGRAGKGCKKTRKRLRASFH